MQSRKFRNKSHPMRPDEEPRDSSFEREYCPECQTIFVPVRGCWCSGGDDENPPLLREAA